MPVQCESFFVLDAVIEFGGLVVIGAADPDEASKESGDADASLCDLIAIGQTPNAAHAKVQGSHCGEENLAQEADNVK